MAYAFKFFLIIKEILPYQSLYSGQTPGKKSALICLIRGINVSLFIFAPMQHVKDDLQVRWLKLRIKLKERFGIKPDMDGILFLIGIQELGSGKQDFSKEEKQDLMHIAVCTVLSLSGYYVSEGQDEEGWPHFKQQKPLPGFIMIEQENFLKDHILLYFQNQNFID
jgi:hypothetical protein